MSNKLISISTTGFAQLVHEVASAYKDGDEAAIKAGNEKLRSIGYVLTTPEGDIYLVNKSHDQNETPR